jgi:hypothetical protein
MVNAQIVSENKELWYSHCLRTAAVRIRARIGLNETEWVQERMVPFYQTIEQACIDGDFNSAAYALDVYNQASRWLEKRGA